MIHGSGKRWKVAQFIPKRTHNRGPTPGITGSEALGPEAESEHWTFPDLIPSDFHLKLLMAACLAVGVATTFRLHTFTFGGALYQQLMGGLLA